MLLIFPKMSGTDYSRSGCKVNKYSLNCCYSGSVFTYIKEYMNPNRAITKLTLLEREKLSESSILTHKQRLPNFIVRQSLTQDFYPVKGSQPDNFRDMLRLCSLCGGCSLRFQLKGPECRKLVFATGTPVLSDLPS